MDENIGGKMKISRSCNLKTFYQGMAFLPVSINRDFLLKLDPTSVSLPCKRSKKFYIEKIKKINPSLSQLWKVRDELFQEGLVSLKNDLTEIRTSIEELNN